jgi:hypothetical protein
MTTSLSDEQRQALEQGGGPVYVVDPTSRATYVLLPEATYQRIAALFGGPDAFELQETYAVQDEAAAQAWSDPADAEYDDYDAHRGRP